MKPFVAVCCLVLAVAAGAAAAAWFLSSAPLHPDDAGAATASATHDQQIEALRTEIAAMSRRIEAFERAQPVAASQRSDALALDPSPAGNNTPDRDPIWYLEQYVLSFADDTQGSEYFRLAVEAWVVELATPISALVRDAGRPINMRIALVNMLGKRRFDESGEVIEALLVAFRSPAPAELASRAIEALARIGSARALPGIEAALPSISHHGVRERALTLLVEASGDGANAVLLRLFARAPDDTLQRQLVRLLSLAESQAALELLRSASGGAQPLRLDAARKTVEYDEPGFDAFVASWLQTETDAEVIAVLGGGQGKPKEIAGWSPAKATGAPDADPRRDDPNAWAPRNPEMGLQWLQLTYATPMRASGVRIFEVNAPGAVAEVRARADGGTWVTLWRGTADGAGSPLLIQFPLTSFAVKTIRIVVDTDRTPSWNEIDAVELLGPSGGQWASRASASSTFASNGDRVSNEAMFMENAVKAQAAQEALQRYRAQQPR